MKSELGLNDGGGWRGGEGKGGGKQITGTREGGVRFVFGVLVGWEVGKDKQPEEPEEPEGDRVGGLKKIKFKKPSHSSDGRRDKFLESGATSYL